MDPRRLADDTQLCLTASALHGRLELSRAQRELLKAVGRCEVVSEIIRHSRLPERFARQQLAELIEGGLVSFKGDSGSLASAEAAEGAPAYRAPMRSDVTRRATRPDGSVLHTPVPDSMAAPVSPRFGAAAQRQSVPARVERMHPQIVRVPRPGALANLQGLRVSDTETPFAPRASTDGGDGNDESGENASVVSPPGVVRHGPIRIGRPQRLGTLGGVGPWAADVGTWAADQEKNTTPADDDPTAAERLRVTKMPSTIPDGSHGADPMPSHLPAIDRIVPQAPILPRIDALSEHPGAKPAERDADPGQTDVAGASATLQAARPDAELQAARPDADTDTDTSRTSMINELQAENGHSRPAPRVSGIEGLHPDAREAAELRAAGAGAEDAMVRLRLPPSSRGSDDPMAGETIPLVKVVRRPVVTLGGPRQGAPGTPMQTMGIKASEIRNAAPNARPSHPRIPGEQPAANQAASRASGGSESRRESNPGEPTPTRPANPKPQPSSQPPGAENQSGSTIEGMPAQRQGSAAAGSKAASTLESMPAVRVTAPDKEALGTTLAGGADAERRDRNPVVVRSGSSDPSKLEPAGPTGRTLLGVLAPTAEELGGTRTQRTSSTSSTMPSLQSLQIRTALSEPPPAVSIRKAGDSGELEPSDDTLDHYQVLECLAKGGSGVVYRVQDPSTGASQSLALKVLRQGQHREPGTVAELSREAQLMAALDHPNLVQYVHFGHENGEPFLLMEYVEGLSMSELLHHPVPLPLDVGLIIIQDALEALDYAHNVRLAHVAPRGLVHCDVSPQNLLCGTDGLTRLIDFGTSRAPGETVGDAAIRCKPRYSSPEVMAGEGAGPEADIFSMGAVLFQLLSKQPAFSADPKRRKRESLVPNPSLLNRRAPTPFDPICQRALDPHPERRFSSAREMLETLDRAVEIAGIELRRARVNFWVRRVIQSHHGDVEFDMSELEDLLDNKRGSHRHGSDPAPAPNKPPNSSHEHTKPVQATRTGSSSATEGRKQTLVLSQGGERSTEALSLKRRIWITSAAATVVMAVVVLALLKPELFQSPLPHATEEPARDDLEPESPAPTLPTAASTESSSATGALGTTLERLDPPAFIDVPAEPNEPKVELIDPEEIPEPAAAEPQKPQRVAPPRQAGKWKPPPPKAVERPVQTPPEPKPSPVAATKPTPKASGGSPPVNSGPSVAPAVPPASDSQPPPNNPPTAERPKDPQQSSAGPPPEPSANAPKRPALPTEQPPAPITPRTEAKRPLDRSRQPPVPP